MKVLHVIPSVAAVRGGPSQAVLEMVQTLRSQGLQAEIVTTNDNGPEHLDVPLNRWVDYCPNPEQSSATVPVQFFPRLATPLRSLQEFAFSPALTHWLWRHLPDYDLIHVHAIFSYPSTVAMAIARYHQTPYIVRPLGQLCAWSLQQKSRKKQLYLKLLEYQNLQLSRAIHFTSDQEAAEAESLQLSSSNFILPHGISIAKPLPDARQRLRQFLQIPDAQPVLLFLSRLHPKKGLEHLLKALAECKKNPFTLVIAGEGSQEYEASLNRQIIDYGLQAYVKQVGFVSGAQKQLLLQGADLFTLTSHSENFGIAVLEALAAGLPSLVTPGVALASLVQTEQLGWVVPQEHAEIVSALRQFFQHPEHVQSMRDRARQVVHSRFTWDHVVSRLIQHYEHLSLIHC